MAISKTARRVGIAALVLAAIGTVVVSVPSLRKPVVDNFRKLFGMKTACEVALEAATDRQSLLDYLRDNPESECTEAFAQALDQLDCDEAMQAIDKRKAYEDYLATYGKEGVCYDEIFKAMSLLDCEEAQKTNTKEAYDAYISKYGDEGECSGQFKSELQACVEAENKDNCDTYLNYIQSYPDGVCYDYFLDRIARLDCDISSIKFADLRADDDNDGLTNLEERKYGTDPNNADSDNDGVKDGDEVKQGRNPAGPGALPRGKFRSGTDGSSAAGGVATNIPKNIPRSASIDVSNLSCKTFPNPNGTPFQAVKFGPLWIMTDDANYQGQTLFTWQDAHRKACPKGFRLPCEQELVFYVNEYYRGNPNEAYRGLMGIDACGFNTKIYNNYYRGNASSSLASGVISQFWIATESSDLWAYSFGMDKNNQQFFIKDNTNKEIKLPCRCVKESDQYPRSKISIKYKGCPNWPFPELRK